MVPPGGMGAAAAFAAAEGRLAPPQEARVLPPQPELAAIDVCIDGEAPVVRFRDRHASYTIQLYGDPDVITGIPDTATPAERLAHASHAYLVETGDLLYKKGPRAQLVDLRTGDSEQIAAAWPPGPTKPGHSWNEKVYLENTYGSYDKHISAVATGTSVPEDDPVRHFAADAEAVDEAPVFTGLQQLQRLEMLRNVTEAIDPAVLDTWPQHVSVDLSVAETVEYIFGGPEYPTNPPFTMSLTMKEGDWARGVSAHWADRAVGRLQHCNSASQDAFLNRLVGEQLDVNRMAVDEMLKLAVLRNADSAGEYAMTPVGRLLHKQFIKYEAEGRTGHYGFRQDYLLKALAKMPDRDHAAATEQQMRLLYLPTIKQYADFLVLPGPESSMVMADRLFLIHKYGHKAARLHAAHQHIMAAMANRGPDNLQQFLDHHPERTMGEWLQLVVDVEVELPALAQRYYNVIPGRRNTELLKGARLAEYQALYEQIHTSGIIEDLEASIYNRLAIRPPEGARLTKPNDDNFVYEGPLQEHMQHAVEALASLRVGDVLPGQTEIVFPHHSDAFRMRYVYGGQDAETPDKPPKPSHLLLEPMERSRREQNGTRQSMFMDLRSGDWQEVEHTLGGGITLSRERLQYADQPDLWLRSYDDPEEYLQHVTAVARGASVSPYDPVRLRMQPDNANLPITLQSQDQVQRLQLLQSTLGAIDTPGFMKLVRGGVVLKMNATDTLFTMLEKPRERLRHMPVDIQMPTTGPPADSFFRAMRGRIAMFAARLNRMDLHQQQQAIELLMGSMEYPYNSEGPYETLAETLTDDNSVLEPVDLLPLAALKWQDSSGLYYSTSVASVLVGHARVTRESRPATPGYHHQLLPDELLRELARLPSTEEAVAATMALWPAVSDYVERFPATLGLSPDKHPSAIALAALRNISSMAHGAAVATLVNNWRLEAPHGFTEDTWAKTSRDIDERIAAARAEWAALSKLMPPVGAITGLALSDPPAYFAKLQESKAAYMQAQAERILTFTFRQKQNLRQRIRGKQEVSSTILNGSVHNQAIEYPAVTGRFPGLRRLSRRVLHIAGVQGKTGERLVDPEAYIVE